MAELVIKDVDDATLERLAKQAGAFGRSLQDERKVILKHAAEASPKVSMTEACPMANEMCARLSGHQHTDSAKLLREDRSR